MNGEIIDGDLFASPRPAAPHARAARGICTDLFGNFDGPPGAAGNPGGWWILIEPELHLGDDVLIPDLAGWRIERMPTFPNTAAFRQPPDWVCEVISPSTGALDRGRKMRVYAHVGIPHPWIVDPLARTLEIYRLDAGHWVVVTTHGGDTTVHVEPFDVLPSR